MRYSFQEIKTAIKIHGLLLFSIATFFCNYAQEKNEDEIDDLLEELFFSDQQFLDELIESDFSYNFLYTSVSYNNNTFFAGRDTGTNQFNMLPQVSYYHSSGFNASISGIYYQDFAPNWDFTSLSLGYFNTLGNEFNGYKLKKTFINNEKTKNTNNQKIGSFKNSFSSFLNTSLIKIKNNMMKNKLINKLPNRK